jgi:hypothetical protein
MKGRPVAGRPFCFSALENHHAGINVSIALIVGSAFFRTVKESVQPPS